MENGVCVNDIENATWSKSWILYWQNKHVNR